MKVWDRIKIFYGRSDDGFSNKDAKKEKTTFMSHLKVYGVKSKSIEQRRARKSCIFHALIFLNKIRGLHYCGGKHEIVLIGLASRRKS